jgi:hypothetical protein
LPVESAAIREVKLRRVQVFGALLAAITVAFLEAGCGSQTREGHHAEKAAPAPASPTPDTTPIEALRTPAGMVLKLDAPTPTPAPSK